METTGIIGITLGLYWGNIGIEKKIEAILAYLV